MLYAKLIGRIALFTCENIAHIEFYLQGLLPKILAIYTISSFTAPKLNIGYARFSEILSCPCNIIEQFERFKFEHNRSAEFINGLPEANRRAANVLKLSIELVSC